MKRHGYKRIVLSTVLLAVLLQFMAVKIFHYHKEATPTCCAAACDTPDESDDTSQNPSSAKTCMLCHYVLSPFIEPTPLHPEYLGEIISFIYANEPCTKQLAVSYPYHLRAPPANDFIS